MLKISSGRFEYSEGKTAGKFNWRTFDFGSKLNFIFFHGSGEFGNIDGSQLIKVEKHAYPKLCASKKPFPLPFNVIAVQGVANIKSNPVTTDFKAIRGGLFKFMDSKGIDHTVVGGLSQGSLVALQYLWKDQDPNGRITGIVNVCGKPPSGPSYPKPTDPKEATGIIKNIPIITVHGTKDNSGNGFNSMQKFLKWVQAIPGHTYDPITSLLPIPNGDHDDAWNAAYNPENLQYGVPVMNFIEKNQ